MPELGKVVVTRLINEIEGKKLIIEGYRELLDNGVVVARIPVNTFVARDSHYIAAMNELEPDTPPGKTIREHIFNTRKQFLEREVST